MTIGTKVDIADSASGAGFRYVHDSTVALLSVTGKRDAPSTASKSVLQACATRAAPLLLAILSTPSGGTLTLFAATPFWDHHNVLSRRRGIWGRDELSWLTADARRSADVEITRDSGSRFAGLVEIEASSLFEAADFVRTHESSFLFMSKRDDLSDERVRALFAEVFPSSESTVDWGCVVDQIGKDAAACIRVSGSFDDPDVSLDVFMSADLLAKLRLKPSVF